MEMIKTQDLAFTYPGTEDQVNTRALRGVDVTIERGSFVVILGHNGSGKSTLAKTFKDRKSTRLNSSHRLESRMPSSA